MERTACDWGSTMKNGNNVIKVTLIVDQLYSDIKDRIIRGQLKPDEKLSVRQLCEYYGVSDTPVKQALNRLVTEGFVDALPRRGMRVRCITKQEKENLQGYIYNELGTLFLKSAYLEKQKVQDFIKHYHKKCVTTGHLVSHLLKFHSPAATSPSAS